MSRPLRIAVADDEPDLLEHYRQALARLGHEVVTAARDGRELIEQCRAAMDGVEAAAAVYREAPVPIILASSFHDERLIKRAQDDHVLAYLVKPVRAADLSPAIAIAQRRFDQMRALEGLSLTDELTGLLNRQGFLVLAEQQLKQARHSGQDFALLFADVDGLKAVNDTLGHGAGDRLLRVVAAVLRGTFRGSDVLARLGGDEFCVVVADSEEGGGAAAVQRLLRNVEPYNAGRGDGDPALSLSLGAVEVSPAADLGIEGWLGLADE